MPQGSCGIKQLRVHVTWLVYPHTCYEGNQNTQYKREEKAAFLCITTVTASHTGWSEEQEIGEEVQKGVCYGGNEVR